MNDEFFCFYQCEWIKYRECIQKIKFAKKMEIAYGDGVDDDGKRLEQYFLIVKWLI